jgi:sulfur-oxidizing protein SoxX
LAALAMMLAATSRTVGAEGQPAPQSMRSGSSLPHPLTTQPGDAERGRRVVLDREAGDCTICHAMPLPQRQFHGTIGPPLDNIGARYTAGELRWRIVDAKLFNPESIMPAYYKVQGLHRVGERYRGAPILTAQQVEDVVAYLLTLKAP